MSNKNLQRTIKLSGIEVKTEKPQNGGRKFTLNPATNFTFNLGKKWTGADDPGFKLKIAQGLSATNSYTSEFESVVYMKQAKSRVIGSAGSYWKDIEMQTYGDVASQAAGWDESIVKANTDLAMAKLYGKLQELATPVNGLEFLAEFREAVRMIKHPAKSLGDYLNRHLSKQLAMQASHKKRMQSIYRRRNLTKGKRAKLLAREVNNWSNIAAKLRLEYRFGWEPLVKTVGAATEAALETFPTKGIITSYRKSSLSKVSVIEPVTVQSVGSSSWYVYAVKEYEYKVSLVMRVRYGGQYDGMNALEQLKARSGFMKSQLIPLAWELAPLSVFSDYFVNVGEILSATMTDTKDVVSVDRYVRRRLIKTTYISWRPSIQGAYDPLVHQDGRVVQIYAKYTREKWSMSIPPLRFSSPADSGIKLLNLAAFLKLGFFYK